MERFNDITSFLFGVGANETFIVHSAGIGSVHNSYVNFFGNYGFIALLALLGFIIFILYTAFNQNKMLLGHDNLSMFKNLLKYRHESKKQVCDSFTYFRGQI